MKGVSALIKYFYENEAGALIDITAEVLSCSGIQVTSRTEETTPYGAAGDQHTATGRSSSPIIELGGLFSDGEDGELIDPLFRGRAPEQATTPTRRFREVYTPNNRHRTVETVLLDYNPIPNRENGLTRYTIRLQPTGDVVEAFPS